MMKEKDNMKTMDRSEVIKISEDMGAPAFKRQAAILQRLEKGYYRSDEIGKTKVLLENLGADKKTMSYYDNIVTDKYPQYATRFTRDAKTGEMLELKGVIKQLTAAFKSGILNAHDLESDSFTSQGGRTAYAALAGVTTDQLTRAAGKSAEHKKRLGEGSGSYLINLKLDNETVEEKMKSEEGRDELDEVMKVIGRHFYAAESKNKFDKIFGMDEKGGVRNNKLLENILGRKDAIQLIANLNLKELNDLQKSSVIGDIVQHTDPSNLIAAFDTAAVGKQFQKDSVEEILKEIAEGKELRALLAPADQRKLDELVGKITEVANRNTSLSRNFTNSRLFKSKKIKTTKEEDEESES